MVQNHQVIRKRRKRRNLWHQFLEPKESIKTQNVSNAPILISQSEPPEPKEIMVDKKIRTDIFVLPRGT